MKENNKFSLSAFFCSLGSKSKIFMFFLLGAPFLLVQIFTIKVYANSAVIPVVPEGLTSSGITSSGIVPGDPSLLYYTVLIALGLKADEVYQVNKVDIIDSVTDSLNEYDSVNDPTLGDDLQTYLEWVDNAKAQNGYINELSIPRELWDRLNKATSNGLSLRIQNPSSGITTFNSASDIYNLFTSNGYTQDFNSNFNTIYNYYSNNPSYVFFRRTPTNPMLSDRYDYVLCVDCIMSGTTILPASGNTLHLLYFNRNFNQEFSSSANLGNVSSQSDSDSGYNPMQIISSSFSSVSNKSVGVARPFISSKVDGTYDVVSKSATFDHEGKIGGDVTISVLSEQEGQTLANDDPDSATDIPPVIPRMRIVPIDILDPDVIPDVPGIPGETPEEIAEELADTVDPSPVDPVVIEPFRHLDEWDPFIPDPTPEPPLVGLPAVMNWLAVQMQTTMYLTQFSNCWLVLSTLVVAACMIGLVRIWR